MRRHLEHDYAHRGYRILHHADVDEDAVSSSRFPQRQRGGSPVRQQVARKTTVLTTDKMANRTGCDSGLLVNAITSNPIR